MTALRHLITFCLLALAMVRTHADPPPQDPIPASYQGKDVNQQLIWAAQDVRDHPAWALTLIAQGADANPANPPRGAPLEYALDYGNQGVALVLLNHGANGKRTDRNGQNAAWNASFAYYSPEPLEWLIQHKVPVTGVNLSGETILQRMMHSKALETGKPAFLPTVVYTKADTKAYHDRERQVAELLVAAGADINAQEPASGDTALMYALKSGHYEAARVLLNHGALVTSKDQGGETAYDIVESCIPAGPVRAEFEVDIKSHGGGPK